MINPGAIGQYVPGNSLLHRLDPRVKILCTLGVTVVVFFPRGLWDSALVIAFVLASAVLSRVPPRLILRGLKPVAWFALAVFVLGLFHPEGEVVEALGPLRLPFQVTDEALRLGVGMAVRLLLLVLAASLLTFTTTPIALTDGMERLLRPFGRVGLPAHELALMMSVALRFIPTLLEEAGRIMRAQSARGSRLGSGRGLGRLKGFVPVLVPLFVSAFARADELAVAMEARSYRGGQHRTRMRQLQLRPADALAALVTAAMVAGVLWLRFGA